MKSLLLCLSLILILSCSRANTAYKEDIIRLPQLTIKNQKVEEAVADYLERRQFYSEGHEAFVLVVSTNENSYDVDLKNSALTVTQDTAAFEFRLSGEALTDVNGYIQTKQSDFAGYYIYENSAYKDIPFFIFGNSIENFFSHSGEVSSFDFIHPLKHVSGEDASKANPFRIGSEPIVYAYEVKNEKLKFIGAGWEYALFD